MPHVQRTRVTSTHQRGCPSSPPLRRPQVEPVWHRTKLGKPLSGDGLIHGMIDRQERSVGQAPGAPLRFLNQTVAPQVGQRPRQVVIDQARVLLARTLRWRRCQLARAESTVCQRTLMDCVTPCLASKRLQGVERRRPGLLAKNSPLGIVQRFGHAVYSVTRFHILRPTRPWPTDAPGPLRQRHD